MTNNSISNTYIKLSIQINLDGFYFCILNESYFVQEYKTILFPQKAKSSIELLEEVKKTFQNQPLLHQSFKEITVIHQNNMQTLVPNEFFDENQLSIYLKDTVKTFDHDYFDYDDVDQLNAKSVYIPFVSINNYIFDNFGSFHFFHANTIFTKFALKKYISFEKEMFINIYHQSYHIVVIKNDKVILSNHFDFNSKEDFIYYILFTAEQLQMDPNNFDLHLYGNISVEDPNFKIAYKYIRYINIEQEKIDDREIKDLNLIYTHL